MSPEKREFITEMNEEIIDFISQLKVKYDMDMEFMGSFYFRTNSGIQAGTVLGEYSNMESLANTANSFFMHVTFRKELLKRSLEYLYNDLVKVDPLHTDEDASNTDELNNLLRDINNNLS